jgi:hypothetical protein
MVGIDVPGALVGHSGPPGQHDHPGAGLFRGECHQRRQVQIQDRIAVPHHERVGGYPGQAFQQVSAGTSLTGRHERHVCPPRITAEVVADYLGVMVHCDHDRAYPGIQ